MHAEEYKRLYDLEDQYWWFVARRHLAIGLIERALKDRSPQQKPLIVDLGCGTGAVLKELTTWTQPIGLDMSPLAIEFCRTRGLSDLVRADGTALPFSQDAIDGIISLDVYEHIEHDDVALAESFRILKPGGVLVLSVPAFKSLWGPHDVALMHIRRYRQKEMVERLERVGFVIEKASYSIFFLFPIVAITRVFEKLKRGEPKASLPRVPRFLNRFLIWVQSIEASIISSHRLPWGTSVVVVARKPR